MEVRAENSNTDFSGGTLSSVRLGLPDKVPVETYFFPLVLPPGHTLAFSAVGGAAPRSLMMNFFWLHP